MAVLPEHKIAQVEEDLYEIAYQDNHNRPKYLAFNGIDMHVMCKQHLENMIANT